MVKYVIENNNVISFVTIVVFYPTIEHRK